MPTVRRILLATDLNTDHSSAAEFVAVLAGQLGAQLHLLHVSARLPKGNGHDPLQLPDEQQAQLDRLTLATSLQRVDVTAAVRSGRAAEEIVAYAQEAEIGLIAMGSRGRNHLTQALLGSVAEQVVRTAPCPVLILPPLAFKMNGRRLSAAARKLQSQFGPGLVGPKDESRARIVEVIRADQQLGDVEAQVLADSLEAAGALVWHAGNADAGPNSQYWSIMPDAVPESPVELASPEEPHADPEQSAALELLRRARDHRATDAHLAPISDRDFEVRFRIDGRIEHYCRLDRKIAVPLIQQFKVLANLDVADPFKPQEGRLRLPPEFASTEVRVTTAPVYLGQALALRLFSSERVHQPLAALGLTAGAMESVNSILKARSGLVLVTGPTGSGKTTTIYSLLRQVSTDAPNIISIEDPVEFRLPFLRQVDVDPRHQVTMTTGLRTILRMDPDVVFLGEIRDAEAAEIAMRAASAGRFVFSTLHTRDVASTITALRDLHLDARSLGANITGIISQRLVRRLCPSCSRAEPLADHEAEVFRDAGLPAPAELRRPAGCEKCRNTGYFDRIGIFEVASLSGPASEAIVRGVPESEFGRVLRESGAPSLLADGLTKVAAGFTTLDEVLGMQSLRGAVANG